MPNQYDIYHSSHEMKCHQISINNIKRITDGVFAGFLDARNICCGYHEDGSHVWCGNKAQINGSEVYAGSCEDPSRYISWDGIHYTEAANYWVANHIIDGSFSDPPLSITNACQKGRSL